MMPHIKRVFSKDFVLLTRAVLVRDPIWRKYVFCMASCQQDDLKGGFLGSDHTRINDKARIFALNLNTLLLIKCKNLRELY